MEEVMRPGHNLLWTMVYVSSGAHFSAMLHYASGSLQETPFGISAVPSKSSVTICYAKTNTKHLENPLLTKAIPVLKVFLCLNSLRAIK